MVLRSVTLLSWLRVATNWIQDEIDGKAPSVVSFPIVSDNSPNEGLFIDSLKHYPRGQRLRFEMKIRCEPKCKTIPDLTLCGMELHMSACYRRPDNRDFRNWFLFIATTTGSTVKEEGSGYWGDLALRPCLVVGEFCPDLRCGRIGPFSVVEQ